MIIPSLPLLPAGSTFQLSMKLTLARPYRRLTFKLCRLETELGNCSNAPQGLLQCWVDVMELGDSKAFEPEAVALPPAADFEVNVIVLERRAVFRLEH